MDNASSQDTVVVVLYATEIGGILGLNPYCTRTEVVKRAWYRLRGDEVPFDCRPSPDQLKMTGDTKPGREFKKSKYTIQDHARFDELVGGLKARLVEEGRPDLVQSVPGFIRTEMGKNSESLAVDIAEEEPEIGQCRSMQHSFKRLAWRSADGKVEVFISGRIDCRDKNGRIVEIKTRLGRRPQVTPTEHAQLQTYLFLADEQHGYVIELYDGDKVIANPIQRFDQRWWNEEVIPALISFADDLATSIKAKSLVLLSELSSDNDICE